MNELQEYIKKCTANMLQMCSYVEVSGIVGDSAYSIEIFFTCDGKRTHCFSMVDQGSIDDSKLQDMIKGIAHRYRKLPCYLPGTINEISLKVTL